MSQTTTSPVQALRTTLRARRSERAAIRRLRRDLACYTHPADIHDLLAMTERHEGPQAERMRSVLLDNLSEHHRMMPFAHL